jgi:hypothetical protein
MRQLSFGLLDLALHRTYSPARDGDVMEYVWDHPQVRPIGETLPYFVALPTTSGTGSEVGRSSVISEEETHVKRVVFSPLILAKVVFADPELTVGLPPSVTAATGMDALTHNVESYLRRPITRSAAASPSRARASPAGPWRWRCASRAFRRSWRHDDELGGGSDRLPEGPGRRSLCAHALGTVCDMHGLANADDRHRARLEREAVPRVGRAGAVGTSGGAAGFLGWLKALKKEIGIAEPDDRGRAPRRIPPRRIATADICHQTNRGR